MGCDIHGFLEVNIYYNLKERGYIPYWKGFLGTPPLARHYRVFSILAGVRKYSETLPIIDKPRGLPEDISDEMRLLAEDFGQDGHSHSWVSCQELLGFNWSDHEIRKEWLDWFELVNHVGRVYGVENLRFVFFFDG